VNNEVGNLFRKSFLMNRSLTTFVNVIPSWLPRGGGVTVAGFGLNVKLFVGFVQIFTFNLSMVGGFIKT
jgi:hypothetical protein